MRRRPPAASTPQALGEVQRIAVAIPGGDFPVAKRARDFAGVMFADLNSACLQAAITSVLTSTRQPPAEKTNRVVTLMSLDRPMGVP
jgi:hypothetical protein